MQGYSQGFKAGSQGVGCSWDVWHADMCPQPDHIPQGAWGPMVLSCRLFVDCLPMHNLCPWPLLLGRAVQSSHSLLTAVPCLNVVSAGQGPGEIHVCNACTVSRFHDFSAFAVQCSVLSNLISLTALLPSYQMQRRTTVCRFCQCCACLTCMVCWGFVAAYDKQYVTGYVWGGLCIHF